MSPSSPAAKRSSEPAPTEIPMLIGGAWRAPISFLRPRKGARLYEDARM